MIVTDITEFSKSRYKIFIDEEFAFVLYKGELRKYGIKKDDEISKETYEEIVSEVIPKRAKLRAMNLLQKRPYTERDMRNKLREGFYPQDAVDIAIEYLKGFGYIDDRAYVLQYIDTYSSDRSTGRLQQDLMKKGIDKDVIRDVLSLKREEGDLPDEKAMIRKLLEKRGLDLENADSKEIAKTARFLYQKGFSGEMISAVLRRDF